MAVHTSGRGCEVRIDCSGNAAASESAVRNTRTSGSCVFVGEGGTVTLSVSELLIHKQLTVHGSWVSSTTCGNCSRNSRPRTCTPSRS